MDGGTIEVERAPIAYVGEIVIRPLHRVDDEAAYTRFGMALAAEDLRMRLAGPARWSSELAPRLFGFDGTPFAAFDDRGQILGVAGIVENDISLAVRSDLKRHGLGRVLLRHLLSHAFEHGFTELGGSVLSENRPMLELAKAVGFRATGFEGPLVSIRLCLP
jgi:acetyltransferase